ATRSRGTLRIPFAASRSARADACRRGALSKENGYEILYPEDCRSSDHDEQRRQDEECQREEHLDRQFPGCLLGTLTALGPQQVGVCAQGLTHARPEPVALDDETGKSLQVIYPIAVAEATERILTSSTTSELERHESKLLAERIVQVSTFLSDPRDRRIQAETRFQASGHEVERVR